MWALWQWLAFRQSRQIDSKDDEEQGPSVEEDEVRERLNKLGAHKSMEPDGMHPPVWGSWSISLQGHSLFNLSKVIGIESGNWGQEENKCHSYLQKEQEVQQTAGWPTSAQSP